MTFKDLPESLQMQILEWSNKYMRDNNIYPTEWLTHLDEAMAAGIVLEATRHNSKAESLWQTLSAFRNMLIILPAPKEDAHLQQLSSTIALVDQCLIENKPEII